MRLGVSIGIDAIKGVAKPNGNPSACTITVISDTELQVNWTNGATNLDGTYVYYSLTEFGTYTLGATVVGSGTSGTISGLTENVKVYVKVAHYKGSKLSEFSNIDSDTPYSLAKDLSLNYTSRSGLNLLETGSGSSFNAKILTPCFIGNNSGYYSFKSAVNLDQTSVIDIDFAVNIPEDSNNINFLGTDSASASRFYFRHNTTNTLATASGVTIATFNSAAFAGGGYKVCKLSFNANTITLTVNGNVYTNSTSVPATWALSFKYIGKIGANLIKSPTKIYYLFIGTTYKFYFNQVGVTSARLYDALNSNHATAVSIVAYNKTYDNQGSTFPYDTGYSLWQKSGSADIYVPYTSAGAAQPLVAGTDLPAGYTKSIDIAGSLLTMIPFDSLIGMNETSDASALLAHFDRSNETIQTAASRASAYYDTTSLATKSRYHVTEIIDPRVYFTLFNVGYNKYFGKVTTSLISTTYYFTALAEMRKYSADITDYKEHKILQYCGLDIFEVLDGKGNYTIDGNNYVIIA